MSQHSIHQPQPEPVKKPYLSIAEAARLGPFSVDQIKHWMKNGTLTRGLHFTCPRGTRPLIVRTAFEAYLRGEDSEIVADFHRQRRSPGGKVNWDAAREIP